jgi:hypothetical protein
VQQWPPAYLQVSGAVTTTTIDFLAAWWPFSTTTNASGAYDDATTYNNDLWAGTGAAQPTYFAASNGIGNNLRFDSGDSATSTISQTIFGYSWWGRSNDQHYSYFSSLGGTQTINGAAGSFDTNYWLKQVGTVLTLGNGNVAAFGDPKVWMNYSDPATNFSGQATNWGWELIGYDATLWSNCVSEITMSYSSVDSGSSSVADTGYLANRWKTAATHASDGTNGWTVYSGSVGTSSITGAAVIADNDNLDWSTPGRSLETWVQWGAIGQRTIVGKSNLPAANYSGYLFHHNGTHLYLIAGKADGSAMGFGYYTVALSTGRWYHVVGVWESNGNMSLYMDGTNKAWTGTSGLPFTNSTANAIAATVGYDFTGGGSSANNYWAGRISAVRNYNIALTGTQVTNLYLWGKPKHP